MDPPAKIVEKVVIEKQYPPALLVRDCPLPAFTGDETGDVFAYAADLIEELKRCNADKAALREWMK